MENPMDRGAWKAAVHGVAEGQTWLNDFTFTFHFPALEKEMATHFSVLAWRIPGTGEPGELLSMGSHRVGHDWSDLAAYSIYTCIHMGLYLNINICKYLHNICKPWCCTPSVQFSRSVMSNSLWPHGLQHARPPCPSPTPRACSNSCP